MGQRAGRLWRKIWKRFCRKGECSLLFMNRGLGEWNMEVGQGEQLPLLAPFSSFAQF